MTRTTGHAAPEGFVLREDVTVADLAEIRAIVQATGFFSDEEVDIAAELVEQRLELGPASDYEFLVAEREGRLAGYTCFGRTPGTVASWDLYWIVVAPELQGQGLGGHLLAETESRIRAAGGRRVYAETSSRPLYEPTRRFYIASGYRQEALLEDFYAPGDGKVIYCRVLGP